jgi:hypothetical protein
VIDQQDLFDPDVVRSLLDQLLADARLLHIRQRLQGAAQFRRQAAELRTLQCHVASSTEAGASIRRFSAGYSVRPVTASKSRACRERAALRELSCADIR